MERLMLQYLPDVLKNVRDFQCLMAQYQTAFEDLWEKEAETEDDFYIETAGERGIAHWERILDIDPRPESPLSERRQIVAARVSHVAPYSWRVFLDLLTALIGEEEGYRADRLGFQVTVWLMPGRQTMRNAVWKIMQYMLPANIQARLRWVFRTHGELAKLSHREMTALRHNAIGERVREVERL